MITSYSVKLLRKSDDYIQSYEDELESFFWVLLWICLLYLPHDFSTDKRYLEGRVTAMFNQAMHVDSGSMIDGDGKLSYLRGDAREFSMEGNEPLTALLTGLGEIFFARYPVRRKGRISAQPTLSVS
jgi:hypothetical protein